MSVFRVLLLVPVLAVAACASAPDQYASRDCKVVAADFPNVPKKNATPAEQAEAQLKMQRFAYSHPGYNTGNDMPAQIVRDCY